VGLPQRVRAGDGKRQGKVPDFKEGSAPKSRRHWLQRRRKNVWRRGYITESFLVNPHALLDHQTGSRSLPFCLFHQDYTQVSASISAQIISIKPQVNGYVVGSRVEDYLNETYGRFRDSQAPNLECFVNRIATNPERLANVYFDTVLVLRAIARAAPYLEAYDIETARSKNDLSGIEADKKAKQQLKAVLEMARESGASAFDEKALFNGDDAIVSLKRDVVRSVL
jgi:hypothetical protein